MSNEEILDKHYPKYRTVFRAAILKAMEEACREEMRYRHDEAASSLLLAQREARQNLEEQTNKRLQTLDEINQCGLLQLEKIDKILSTLTPLQVRPFASVHSPHVTHTGDLYGTVTIQASGTHPSALPIDAAAGPLSSVSLIFPSFGRAVSEHDS